jgi:hypothetical protein
MLKKLFSFLLLAALLLTPVAVAQAAPSTPVPQTEDVRTSKLAAYLTNAPGFYGLCVYNAKGTPSMAARVVFISDPHMGMPKNTPSIVQALVTAYGSKGKIWKQDLKSATDPTLDACAKSASTTLTVSFNQFSVISYIEGAGVSLNGSSGFSGTCGVHKAALTKLGVECKK